jgi:hypothetical protein
VPTEPLGPPPDHLPPAEAACWAELVGMVPPGSLRRADRWMVEIGAYVLNRWRVQGRPEDGVVLADCLRLLGVMVPGERVN